MKLCFQKYCVESSFSNDDFERLENHFEKWVEDFVTNMSNNNNLSQFSYRCHILGESNSSLSPNFWISEFPCLTHVFEMKIPSKWKRISKNWARFFLTTNQYTKSSSSLYTTVLVGDIWVNLWEAYFQKFLSFSDTSQIQIWDRRRGYQIHLLRIWNCL